MEVLEHFPVILTKDKDWFRSKHIAKEGSIILLPEDAVLVKTVPVLKPHKPE